MNILNKTSFFSLLTFVLISSCSKKPDVEYTAPYKLAGEWWATMKVGGTDVGAGHHQISTYNTAANSNEIWVDDLKHLYGFKVKATGDIGARTFSSTNALNPYYVGTSAYPEKVTITNGKVIENAGRTKTGNPVDSIYMEAEFSDDPGKKYVISGHFRTGFFEDEY
jgi:hypothetical protein